MRPLKGYEQATPFGSQVATGDSGDILENSG